MWLIRSFAVAKRGRVLITQCTPFFYFWRPVLLPHHDFSLPISSCKEDE